MYPTLGCRYLAPTIGDTGGSQKNKTSVREKNPFEPIPARKNMMSQVEILADAWHVIYPCWYSCIISVGACGEED